MALAKDISAEQLPGSQHGSMLSLAQSELQQEGTTDATELQTDITNLEHLSEIEMAEKLENILLHRIKDGDKAASFQLGQLYFEQEQYDKAVKYFEKAVKYGDWQAMFQLGVIYYDGLAETTDHKLGFDHMKRVAESSNQKAKHLIRAAQYNVGRAYFQGYGVQQSDSEAERYWLLAADDGNPKASIKAQSMLGMFYSREEKQDLKKAFFWHSEACGNGSLESQGAMGVMYMLGLGTGKDYDSAFVCLREAAERGNVYAMGNLVGYYYKRKLYTKAVQLASRVALLEDVNSIAAETDCQAGFISKGISMACFYYARCLHEGRGVQKDEVESKSFYTKSCKFDREMCARLQDSVQKGEI